MCMATKLALELNRSLPVSQQDGTRQRRAIRFTSGTHAAVLVQPIISTLQPTTRHSPPLQREPTLHQPTRLKAATATTFQQTSFDTTPTPTSTRLGSPCTHRAKRPLTSQHLGAASTDALSTRLSRPVTGLALAHHRHPWICKGA